MPPGSPCPGARSARRGQWPCHHIADRSKGESFPLNAEGMTMLTNSWRKKLIPVTKKRPERARARRRSAQRLQLECLESRDLLSSWTPLKNLSSFGGVSTMLLLSDGTVMAQVNDSGFGSNSWAELTPDATGSYVNGTWSSLPSMSTVRRFYASEVLPSGKVFVLGGEYSGSKTQVELASGEIYD